MGCNKESWLSFTLNLNYRSDKRLLDRFAKTFSYMSKMDLLKYDLTTDVLRGIKSNNISEDLLVVPISYNNSDKIIQQNTMICCSTLLNNNDSELK